MNRLAVMVASLVAVTAASGTATSGVSSIVVLRAACCGRSREREGRANPGADTPH